MKWFLLLVLIFIPSFVLANDCIGNAFDIVNQKRAAQGLKPYVFDPELQELCERITLERGETLHEGHLRNDMFTELAQYEGVGWYGGIDLEGKHFITCFLYEKKVYKVGATYCVDDSGITFYTLILNPIIPSEPDDIPSPLIRNPRLLNKIKRLIIRPN
jgi:hypothetical protein